MARSNSRRRKASWIGFFVVVLASLSICHAEQYRLSKTGTDPSAVVSLWFASPSVNAHYGDVKTTPPVNTDSATAEVREHIASAETQKVLSNHSGTSQILMHYVVSAESTSSWRGLDSIEQTDNEPEGMHSNLNTTKTVLISSVQLPKRISSPFKRYPRFRPIRIPRPKASLMHSPVPS